MGIGKLGVIISYEPPMHYTTGLCAEAMQGINIVIMKIDLTPQHNWVGKGEQHKCMYLASHFLTN